MPTAQELFRDPEFNAFSVPEQHAILGAIGDREWNALGKDNQLGVLSQFKERENPVKSEQPEAQLMGALLGSVIPGGASAVASKVLGGVQGLKGVAARSAVDLATEAGMQLGGLSNAGAAGLTAAGGIGPTAEAGAAVARKVGSFGTRYIPGMKDVLKEEGVATAKDAAAQLGPAIPSKAMYVPLDAQTAGMEIQFPGSIKYAEKIAQQKRLFPSPDVEQFIRRAPGELQVPGTPGTPAQTVNTGLLDAQGRPLTRTIPGTPGTPAKGISFEDAKRDISDIGDDIRKAKQGGDNKTANELTLIREQLGSDMKQGLGQSLGKGYKEADAAFRLEKATEDVQDMIATSTKSAGGVDKINFDQAVNKIEKMKRDDTFFRDSFPAGELEAHIKTLRDLAKETVKYSQGKEFAFTARMGSILAGGVGGALAAAGSPILIATALKSEKGRAMVLRMVRGGPPTGGLTAFVRNYRPGRAAAQGLRGGIEGGVGEEE